MSMSPNFNMTQLQVIRRIARMLPILAVLIAGLASVAGCRTAKPVFDEKLALGTNAPGTGLANFVPAGGTNRLKPEWLKPSAEPFRLGPGDRIEIEIMGSEGTRSITFVCPDGKIYYDLLPGLEAWGLTIAELKQLLERELSAFYKRPRIAVNLRGVESKCVWALGRLNKPGLLPLAQPMTVIEAVSQAGGLYASQQGGTTEELADLSHSFLIRNGEMLPVDFQSLIRHGDTSQNVYLQADDFIYIPSSLSKEIYVLGAVNKPCMVGYTENITLLSAIARALGPQPQAHLSQIAIVRGSLAQPKISVVDFKAILIGKSPDVRLSPRDIVYVPLSPYRTLERYTKMITDSFVRTVAANEGGHAGATSFSGIGVSNPIQ